MSWILKVFNRRFERPRVLRDQIDVGLYGLVDEWRDAGLCRVFDATSGQEIFDVRYLYSTDRRGYSLATSPDDAYEVTNADHKLNVTWVNAPILITHEWHDVYKEERENYVLTRAKNLSKQDPHTVFAVQPHYRMSWGRNSYDGKRDRYFYAGKQITTDEFKELYVALVNSAEERYVVKRLRRDEVAHDSVVTALGWEQSAYSYSSYTVAKMEGTGRNKTQYSYMVVSDIINELNPDTAIYDGKVIEVEDIVKSLESLIEAQKTRQTYIIPPDKYPSLSVLKRWDLNTSSTHSIQSKVRDLQSDLRNVAVVATSHTDRSKLQEAAMLLDAVYEALE